MNDTIRMAALGVAASLAMSGAAQAALVDRGGGLIYDTDLNVTWLQDANYAKTSGYDADGLMTWSQATAWAANLSYYDSVRNVTYTDWRLPTVNPINGITLNYSYAADGSSDFGYNISKPGTVYAGSAASEMAHLYYVDLGNPGYRTTADVVSGCYVNASDTCLDNTGPFTNFQAYAYWSGTEDMPDTHAWYFGTGGGIQYYSEKTNSYYAFAVRPGDVATVPEAQTVALMLAGLGLVGWRARRRG